MGAPLCNFSDFSCETKIKEPFKLAFGHKNYEIPEKSEVLFQVKMLLYVKELN